MTKLKCPHCGSTDTMIKSASELNEKFNTDKFTQLSSGMFTSTQMVNIILAILTFGSAIFGYLKSKEDRNKEEAINNRSILVCKSCNAWKKIG